MTPENFVQEVEKVYKAQKSFKWPPPYHSINADSRLIIYFILSIYLLLVNPLSLFILFLLLLLVLLLLALSSYLSNRLVNFTEQFVRSAMVLKDNELDITLRYSLIEFCAQQLGPMPRIKALHSLLEVLLFSFSPFLLFSI